MRLQIILLLGLLSISSVFLAQSDIVYVDKDAVGLNDGTSWANAYNTVQNALNNFSGTEQIWVAEGTYFTAVTNRTKSFDLVDGMEIYGGFVGSESAIGERDLENHQTILSGAIGAAGPLDNAYHVVTAFLTGGSAKMDGFVIENGYADGSSNDVIGGGVLIMDGFFEMTNCVIRNNYSLNSGGGVAAFNGDQLIMTDCTIFNNQATYGGGVSISGIDTCLLNRCNFISNDAEFGGGYITSGGSSQIDNCLFQGNTALITGGGCNFYLGNVSFTNTVFKSNHAEVGGSGIVCTEMTDVSVSNSNFSSNLSSDIGAVYSFNSPTILENCLFDENEFSSYCVLLFSALPSEIINCTFARNNATNVSSSICIGLIGSSCNFRNNIVWGNESTDAVYFEAGSVVENNFIEGGFPGINFDVDPRFVDILNGDYHLSGLSYALNRGDQLVSNSTIDLDGNDRVSFGEIDLGCYESTSCGLNNDACDDLVPIAVDAPAIEAINLCSTSDGDTPLSCSASLGKSVWFVFTAPSTGAVEITTSDYLFLTPGFNLKIGLFEGGCSNLTELQCENSLPSGGEEVMIADFLTPGEIYRLRVEATNDQAAFFKIGIAAIPSQGGCEGDYNNDGTRNSSDLLTLLSDFGCVSGCMADLSGDGEVNVVDLLTFLSVFGFDCPINIQ